MVESDTLFDPPPLKRAANWDAPLRSVGKRARQAPAAAPDDDWASLVPAVKVFSAAPSEIEGKGEAGKVEPSAPSEPLALPGIDGPRAVEDPAARQYSREVC